MTCITYYPREESERNIIIYLLVKSFKVKQSLLAKKLGLSKQLISFIVKRCDKKYNIAADKKGNIYNQHSTHKGSVKE